jgi:hypothetical protein
MGLFQKFSSEENLKRAFDYFNNETEETSLPLDPLWYPTRLVIDKTRKLFFEKLSTYIRGYNYKPDTADYIYVSKKNLGVRPVAVLSTTDRIIYQAILNPEILGKKIDNRLLDCCYGNRVEGEEAYLHDWRERWHNYNNDQLEALKEGFVYFVEFDISSFFSSISISKLIEILEKDFKISDDKILEILERQLATWNNSDLRLGIPQGSEASFVLANAYLYPLDSYLNEINDGSFKYFRYNDDVVVMAKEEDIRKDIIYKSSVFLQEYNLNLNEKTETAEKKEIKKIIKDKMYFVDYGGIIITSSDKVEQIKKELSVILKKISEKKEAKSDLSKLTYYLKADSYNEIFHEVIDLIPRLSSLAPFVVRYLERYINNPDVFEKVWNQYENVEYRSWDNFWILKLLLSSACAKKHKNFQKKLKKIIGQGDEYLTKIPALYYQTRQNNFTIESDYLKKLLSSSKTIVEKSNYLFLSLYTRGGNFVDILNDFLKEKSVDLQLISLVFLKSKGITNIEFSQTNTFSKIFLGYEIKKAEKIIQADIVKLHDSQFAIIKDIYKETKNISSIMGTERIIPNKYKLNIEKIPIPKNIKSWNRVVLCLSGEKGLGNVKVNIEGDDLFEHKTDFEKLGFKDKRTNKFVAKNSWTKFFYVLAINSGKYPLKEYLSKSQRKEREKRHKWKEEVKVNFINAFGINEDPIKWDSEKEEFIAKMKIVPPAHDRIDDEKNHDEMSEYFADSQKIPARKKR